jgi:hypothetical protein
MARKKNRTNGVDIYSIYKYRNIKHKYKKPSLKIRKKTKEKKLKMDTLIKEQQQKHALVLYVIDKIRQQYNYIPDKLRIVKILYLLDRKFKENTGGRLSNYNYVLEKLGPLAWEILDNLEELKSVNVLSNFNSLYNFKINFIATQDLDTIKSLSSTIDKSISTMDIKFIFDTSENLNVLLNYVHSLPEVKNAKLHKSIMF